MGRSRDIATILSKSEAENSNNLALLNTSSSTGVDSAQVQAIGMKTFSTVDSLPVSNLEAGQQAYVTETNRLYMSNGVGWYNTTLVNITPRFDSAPVAAYTIVDSATPLVITALAIDSDNPSTHLVNQSFASDSAQYMVDITIDSSVFTFTPKSADSVGAEVAAGNLTDSNGDFTYTFKWSDGINFIATPAVITYEPAPASGPQLSNGYWWGYNRFNYGEPKYLSGYSANDQVDVSTTNPNYGSMGGLSSGWGHSSGTVDQLKIKHNIDTYVAGIIIAPSSSSASHDKQIYIVGDASSTILTDINGNQANKTFSSFSMRSGGSNSNTLMWDAPIFVAGQTWFNVGVRNTANNPVSGSGNTYYGSVNYSTNFSSYGGLGVQIGNYNGGLYTSNSNGTSASIGYILGMVYVPASAV